MLLYFHGKSPYSFRLEPVLTDKDKRRHLKRIKTSPEEIEPGEAQKDYPEFGDLSMPANLDEDDRSDDTPDFLK